MDLLLVHWLSILLILFFEVLTVPLPTRNTPQDLQSSSHHTFCFVRVAQILMLAKNIKLENQLSLLSMSMSISISIYSIFQYT